MDKEFEKYMELSEMFGSDISMGITKPEENPEAESLWKKIDSLSSTINDIRSNTRKYMEIDSSEDKALYRSIVQKYIDLADKLWAECKRQIAKVSGSEEPEAETTEKTVVIKHYPEEG